MSRARHVALTRYMSRLRLEQPACDRLGRHGAATSHSFWTPVTCTPYLRRALTAVAHSLGRCSQVQRAGCSRDSHFDRACKHTMRKNPTLRATCHVVANSNILRLRSLRNNSGKIIGWCIAPIEFHKFLRRRSKSARVGLWPARYIGISTG